MEIRPQKEWFKLERSKLTKKVKDLYRQIQDTKPGPTLLDVLSLNHFVIDCFNQNLLVRKEINLDENKLYDIAAKIADNNQYSLFFRYAQELKPICRQPTTELKKGDLDKITYIKSFINLRHAQLPENCSFITTQEEFNILVKKTK